jgi:aspartate aminotransferase
MPENTTELARRVRAIEPSPTLAITARAKALLAAGERVLPMAAGEPDFPTPEPIRAACTRALEAGHTGYAPSAGIPELRSAIRQRVQADLGLEAGDDAVVVGLGAKQCLYNAMQALLEPGCRAVFQTPYWVSYPAQVTLAGAEPVALPVADSGALNRRALDDLDPRGLRLLVLNSPSNPSGQVLDEADLDAVAEVVRRCDLIVLTDDIYTRLVYGGRPPHLLRRHPDLAERTLVIDGLSKTFSMTGWRLGWAVGPPEIIAAMRKIQDQSTSNAVTFVQHAAVAALAAPDALVAPMREAFRARRQALVTGLQQMDGVDCAMPAGAFYAFADFSGWLGRLLDGRPLESTLQLAELLLELERVAVVPGEAFGAPGYLRFSFACSLEVIEEALERVRRLQRRLD